MSQYENYSEVAKSYDQERHPVGADVIAGLLHVYAGKPLKDVHLLDAGCGTGNYSRALIGLGVGKVTLVDGCAEMLNVAKEKLKDAIDKKIVDRAEVVRMPNLPFEDSTFDVILFSLVLHHLDNTANGVEFPAIEKVFHEAKRVLRPNGIILVAENLPIAIKKSAWFYQLNTDLSERFSKMYPSLDQYTSMFGRTGFNTVTKMTFLGTELLGNYYDPKGPLKKEWRNGDSMFGFATEEEIRDIEQKVQEMNDNGTIDQFIKDYDNTSEIGILTLIMGLSK